MMNEQTRKNNKGFSLVELIIVIAIMAVLVAILAPALMRYVEQSRQKADVTAVDEIVTTLKTAYTNSEFDVSGAGVEVELTKGAGIKFKNGGVDVTTNTSDNLYKAIYASEIQDAQLKSSQWGTVTIKLTVATSGALKETVTNSDTSKVDMKDEYKK